ncbi:hypothetical protein TNCV_3013051 [Trichonephila clavipes]|nr:hypothetical protein TNCV_3013051 [Trichonephila clavipes]
MPQLKGCQPLGYTSDKLHQWLIFLHWTSVRCDNAPNWRLRQRGGWVTVSRVICGLLASDLAVLKNGQIDTSSHRKKEPARDGLRVTRSQVSWSPDLCEAASFLPVTQFGVRKQGKKMSAVVAGASPEARRRRGRERADEESVRVKVESDADIKGIECAINCLIAVCITCQ